jgi:hypothetical protein
VSKWLGNELKKYIEFFPWILNNSTEAIRKIENSRMGEDEIFADLDVESLYTRIHIEEAIDRIKWLIIKYCGVKNSHAMFIGDIIRWISKYSFFKCRNLIYHQTIGFAMGGNAVPQIANLFVAAFEVKWLDPNNNIFKPITWMRYLDDIHSTWKIKDNNIEDIEIFIKNILNNSTKSLKFTAKLSKSSSTFLDMEISKRKRWKDTWVLDISLYEKPTNLHLFTSPDSNYPYNYKYSWIYGENVRYCRNNSNPKNYFDSLNNFKTYLERRNYNMANIGKFLEPIYDKRQHFITSHRPYATRIGRTIKLSHHTGWKIVLKHLKLGIRGLNNGTIPHNIKQIVVGKGQNLYNLQKSRKNRAQKKTPPSDNASRSEIDDTNPKLVTTKSSFRINNRATICSSITPRINQFL